MVQRVGRTDHGERAETPDRQSRRLRPRRRRQGDLCAEEGVGPIGREERRGDLRQEELPAIRCEVAKHGQHALSHLRHNPCWGVRGGV